jgi:hypothetical protein
MPSPRAPETLAAAVVNSLSPSLPHCREAARELRLEVSKTPMLFVVDPVHPVALATLPEFPCRAAASSRRSAAWPPLSPPLLASPARAPHVDAIRASNRVPEPEFVIAGELRRCSPPATTVSRRPPPLSRAHASSAAGSRSDAPDSIPPPAPPANSCKADLSQLGQTQPAL